MTQLEALNQALFLALNGAPDSPWWRIAAATVLADDLILLIPLLLLGLWFWGNDARRNVALKACLVALLALGLNQLIGLIWPHPRPFAMGLGHTFIPHAADSSFPSDHMTVFASIGIALVLGREKPLGGLVLLASLTVAWARIYLGVHFPLDMVGAVAVSGISQAVVTPLWTRAGDQTTRLALRLYRKLFAWPIATGWIRR
ncbi:phosphatase PAP2 family protein [Pseudogulbenkiania subflava]|uniref:Undecaprenyl-diphosphatase n=1 Tax=Pseudogulbenkiania subflava DSM 22618 TaxID=1123014 RepID=A0A1Y6C588_9NEIS|nr:phosphatase PAP2 family protein [Pseudogulbenkiania subflava]SMF37445.1 Undecaprenyl-diphosphatase [Pseudogulbenkiania subflava DSM 22618]